MKLFLLGKQTMKQYYRYFATFISLLLFALLLFYVGVFKPLVDGSTLDIPLLCILAGYTLSVPLVLFPHLYHETNVHFVSSMPLTRTEIFFGKYLLGLSFGLLMILGYCSLTSLFVGTQALWIHQVTHYLLLFIYYYHIAVLCYYICGNKLFYSIMVLFISFGPIILYVVFQWFLITTANGYAYANFSVSTIEFLLPLFGACYHLYEGTLYSYTVLYLCLAAVALIFTIVAVRYRRNESHHQSIAFKLLGYVIRTVIAITSASVLIIFIQMLTGQSGVKVAYLIVCLIVAYVIEMVFTKNAKVFYSLKYGVLLCVFIMFFYQGAQSYVENYIPSNPISVTMVVDDRELTCISAYDDIKDDELIEIIKDIHQTARDHSSDYDEISIEFTYKKDFNSYSQRHYLISYDELVDVLSPYLDNDAIFDILLAPENDMVQRMADGKIYRIEYVNDEGNMASYDLTSKEDSYKFEHYLKEEIKRAKENRLDYLENEFKDVRDSDVDIIEDTRDENGYFSGDYIGYISSSLIKNAIEKTFNS